MQFASFPFPSIAIPFSAFPFRLRSLRRSSFEKRFQALLIQHSSHPCISEADHIQTGRCLCDYIPFISVAGLCNSLSQLLFALLCKSVSHCSSPRYAVAIQCCSGLRHCDSSRGLSSPLLFASRPCGAAAIPRDSMPLQSLSAQFLALPCRRSSELVRSAPLQVIALPSQGLALLGFSLAGRCASLPSREGEDHSSRSSRISYLNRPLPLFRHWPKPRSWP